MDAKTLSLAIDARKMLLVLQHLAGRRRSTLQATASLVNKLDAHVLTLVSHPVSPKQKEGLFHHDAIVRLHAGLLVLFKDWVDVPKAFKLFADRETASSWTNRSSLVSHFTVVNSLDEGLRGLLKSDLVPAATAGAIAFDKEALSQQSPFPTVARNGEWLPLLMALGMWPATAVPLNKALMVRMGSGQGRDALRQNQLKLTTSTVKPLRAKPGSKAAASAERSALACCIVTVALSSQAFQEHAEIRRLLDDSQGAEPSAEQLTLSNILSVACQPVAVPNVQDLESAASGVVNTLIKSLTARKKAMATEKAAMAKKAAEKKREQLLTDIKTIDPRLLRELKANPDILRQL